MVLMLHLRVCLSLYVMPKRASRELEGSHTTEQLEQLEGVRIRAKVTRLRTIPA